MSGTEFAEPTHREKRDETIMPSTPAAASLTVGAAFDPAEREADRVADAVLARLRGDTGTKHHAAAEGALQRAASPTPGSGEPVVGMEGGALPPELAQRIERRRGTGQQLGPDVRDRMEGAFGSSLAGVRIHADAEAATLSRSISARAFTRGRDIFFGAGEYRPDTPEGEHMLAHELAHTRQQAGLRRIHRTWDVKSGKAFEWNKTAEVKTLEERRVWFFKDKSGDTMVVKPEDQPVGLGDIVGVMQKKVADVRSVTQRKLNSSDQNWVKIWISRETMTGTSPSWLKRGKFLNTKGALKLTTGMELYDAAEQDAHDSMHEAGMTVIAMSLAEGESTLALAGQNVAPNGPGVVSKMREVMDRAGHVRQLGELTAVDAFLGNQDRVLAANLGNWFYNPAGVITLLDQVDGKSGMSSDFVNGKWNTEQELADLPALSKKAMDWLLRMLVVEVDAATQDKGMKAWADTEIKPGLTRRAHYHAEFAVGLKAGLRRIKKTFSTTRKDVFQRDKHKAKKAIRATANAASAGDSGHDKFGGANVDYYQVLKARAAKLTV
ncbi:MAG: hypothetical protein QOC66_2214 [Pseudonocardiales bacterium]|jgi:hypothetical protein|nr:hypothetical protein [Pseudonocardiales bacterium]